MTVVKLNKTVGAGARIYWSAQILLCLSKRLDGIIEKPVLKYSIVVPFHNEEENVTELYDRL